MKHRKDDTDNGREFYGITAWLSSGKKEEEEKKEVPVVWNCDTSLKIKRGKKEETYQAGEKLSKTKQTRGNLPNKNAKMAWG